ncbi:uncharacterized protein K444DRAFT_560923 [Hyaloscypha bicolor E]|uniref:Uncharacterized protein n=1 Tax=Hyaloscypha bicolor E TaxID=1095630 RepID=A0A2J6TBM3_9HELO|nr:uncharacterized protein K444DRAFT_560923 [Hyaloscypha bicolor E]PMD60383.1 hypothetical protein K444DRAFT_560923 [Hyaloscypha bicolor E]
MKFTRTTMIIALATAAVARNCTPGLKYCGRTLLDIGNYADQIAQALADSNKGDSNGGRDDLFNCIGGSSGVIKFESICSNGCATEPAGVSDKCN